MQDIIIDEVVRIVNVQSDLNQYFGIVLANKGEEEGLRGVFLIFICTKRWIIVLIVLRDLEGTP
jgi:hypothetical protein